MERSAFMFKVKQSNNLQDFCLRKERLHATADYAAETSALNGGLPEMIFGAIKDNYLTFENGTDTLSRNVGKLPT